MAWLPDGEKFSKIPLFILTQLRNVADTQTDRRTDGHRVTAIAALCIASHGKNCAVSMLKLTTDKHEASRSLSATAELLVILLRPNQNLKFKMICFVSKLL